MPIYISQIDWALKQDRGAVFLTSTTYPEATYVKSQYVYHHTTISTLIRCICAGETILQESITGRTPSRLALPL